MYAGHFVGYGTLEGLMEQAENQRAALFAESFSLLDPSSAGLEKQRAIIQVSFLDGEVTHYWRWTIASNLFTPQGEALDPKRAERAQSAADSAWALVKDHLMKSGRQVIRAVTAMPRDLVLIDGARPNFLDYQSEQAVFVSSSEVSHAV